MSAQTTELRVLGPGTITHVGDIPPEQRAYLLFLANRTHSTRRAYEEDLKHYWRWCETFPIRPLQVDKIHVQLYLEYLQTRGLAESTVSRRFGTVRLFLRMAFEEEIIPDDPTKRIKPPKVDHDRQRRTWLSTVAASRLLEAAEVAGPMQNALMKFMLSTAMRVGEVCSLDVESVHRDTGRIWVGFVGKGNRYAEIDLTYAAVSALDAYLGDRTTGPLFLNKAGRRLTRNNVAMYLDELVAAAGVTPFDSTGQVAHATPHSLRRTTAKTLAEHGGDVLDIAEMLRHRSVETTRKSYIGPARARANMARQRVTDIFNMTT